jgi:DNA-binding MarR family transcriptional regulator
VLFAPQSSTVNGMSLTAAPASAEVGSDARRAWRALYELQLHGENHSNFPRACNEQELTPSAGKALLLLSETKPTAMRELAVAFACDASYITAVVDALEQRELAVRRPHPTDRRVRTVFLTPKGSAVQGELKERLGQPPAAVGVLTAEEQGQLADLLEKVAAADLRVQQYRADS